jgi:competence protein ComFC
LCLSCCAELRLIQGPICSCCGLPGVLYPSRCRRCCGRSTGFHRAAAGAVYEGVVRSLVLRLKFRGQIMAAYPLSRMVLAGALRALEGCPPEAVLAVPLHPARRRARGYNQAELIAEHVAQALKVPFLKGVVRRERNTLPQGIGGGGSRQRNVRHAFGPVRAGWPSLMRGETPMDAVMGRRVLLVDDVLSTGATLDQCGQALLAGGALCVIAAAAAT